jgi:hypothetical protein
MFKVVMLVLGVTCEVLFFCTKIAFWLSMLLLLLYKVFGVPANDISFLPVSAKGVLTTAGAASLPFSSLTSRRDEYSICRRN